MPQREVQIGGWIVRLASIVSLAVATFGLAPVPAIANVEPHVSDAYDPGVLLLANIRPAATREAYLAKLLNEFRAADTDGNGLSQQDVERLEQAGLDAGTRRYRANLARLEADLARADTNRDGGLSFEELTAQMGGRSEQAERQKQQFAERDKDGNNRLTAAELVSPPPRPEPASIKKRRDRFARVFAFDPNRDGTLTEPELTMVFERQFFRIDSNGDGTVSPVEYDAGRRLVSDAQSIADLPVCEVPAPRPRSRAIAFATAQGQQLSPVAVGGQDHETGIFDVVIEPGKVSLYVMLSAQDPTIWNVTGAVGRVERLVVFAWSKDDAGQALAAVAGIPASKVFFAEPGCLPAHLIYRGDTDARRNSTLIFSAVTGIQTEADARPGNNESVQLPSLVIERTRDAPPAPAGFAADEWFAATATWRRGLGDINPERLVAKTGVERYEQMPGEIGIARLVAEGVLVPTENYSEYRIVKPLARFPARSTGAGGTSYVLGNGIALPAGKLGSGCVYAGNGAILVQGNHCDRSPRRDMVQVRTDANGKACLYRGGVKEVGCFPGDGRPLRAVDTPEGQVFVPGAADDASAPSPPPPVPVAVTDIPRPSIEIIPAGLAQRW
jgi:hypothetical protein